MKGWVSRQPMDVSVLDRDERSVMALEAGARDLGVTIRRAEPLAKHTTFRIGGPADFYAAAVTVDQLEGLAALGWQTEMPVTVLGGGSNILVSDLGIRGLVIANQTRGHGFWPAYRPGWLQEPAHAGQLLAESGVASAGLARWALRNGYAGLEWAVSVPGTIGGAVIGNAGAHGGDVAANLAWALVSYAQGGRRLMKKADLGFAYRSTLLKQQVHPSRSRDEDPAPVVLAVAFDLVTADPEYLGNLADGYLARRRASQPVEPSAGSIFRNPPGDHAGRLIETTGLKGHAIGGAQISPVHANFIVNTGGASAGDVAALVNLVRRTIWQAEGVRLLPEILFLGEWDVPPLLDL